MEGTGKRIAKKSVHVLWFAREQDHGQNVEIGCIARILLWHRARTGQSGPYIFSGPQLAACSWQFFKPAFSGVCKAHCAQGNARPRSTFLCL
jgi:hypothetical protein